MGAMNQYVLTCLLTVVSLSLGNFLWQAMSSHNWGVALERSWFQAIAVLALGIGLRTFAH